MERKLTAEMRDSIREAGSRTMLRDMVLYTRREVSMIANDLDVADAEIADLKNHVSFLQTSLRRAAAANGREIAEVMLREQRWEKLKAWVQNHRDFFKNEFGDRQTAQSMGQQLACHEMLKRMEQLEAEQLSRVP